MLACFSRLAFTRMIGPFRVSLDVGQGEIRGLEFLLGIELRLIEIVLRVRIRILAEDQNGPRFHLWTEINHADEGMAGHAVAALLILFRTRIKIEDDPDIAGRAGYRKAGHCITERLIATGLAPLQPVDIAIGYAPGSEGLL